MKITKKAISVVMACLIVFASFGVMSFAKTSEEVDTHLQFGADGEFKILHITDIQDDYPIMKATKNLLIKAVETQNPDLIILTGDNINTGAGKSKVTAPLAINEFMSIFEKYKVPVAIVFGNHDAENASNGGLTRKEQISMYEKYDCFIGCTGEDFGDYTSGTYYVPLYASDDANDMVYNLWMIDSGDYNRENDLGGYACVTEKQIEWYKETETKLTLANFGKVPSMAFQHIIVPEIYDALEETDAANAQAERGGVYYKLPDYAKGVMEESPCPPQYNNGQFAAMKLYGDVKAMFFGHDHVNTFEVPYLGTMLCNTPGAGFSTYNGRNIGIRTITLNEENLDTFATEVVTYLELFADDEAALALYDMSSDTTSTAIKIGAFFRYVFALIANMFK